MIAGRINAALIRAHWSEILRVVASIRTGTVTASLILRQLASYPRQNGIAAALRELGRLERTLFTLDWIEDPALRRTTGQELNKGESRNSLARAVFIHRLGVIRDRTYENQQHRASGLNLLVTAMSAIPRGGAIDVAVTGVAGMDDAPTVAFTLKAKGLNARIPPHAEALLAGSPESGTVDAQGIQTYYAGLVARAAGMRVSLSIDRNEVTICATSDANQDHYVSAPAAPVSFGSMPHL